MNGEFDLIARHFAPLAGPEGLGLMDDAAQLAPPLGHDLILTTDANVQGVHFLTDESPDFVARRLLRTNLSDLAAKGARPLGYLLTLALPPEADEAWIAGFAA
ncbi:MAG: AIR synthase related protein, partial [Alphaproteobacteria bacterium]